MTYRLPGSHFWLGAASIAIVAAIGPIRAQGNRPGPAPRSATAPEQTARAGVTPAVPDPPAQERRKALPAGNPLLAPSPDSAPAPGRPTPQPAESGAFADYRQPSAAADAGVDLPIFGYDFFQPARELIDAHRAWLKRRFTAPDPAPRRDPDSAATTAAPGNPGELTEQLASESPAPLWPLTAAEKRALAGMSPEQAAALLARRRATAKAAQPAPGDEAAPNRASATGAEPVAAATAQGVSAYEEVADPLSQLYRNVAATAPANYPLAAGDTLVLRYWSPRQEARTVNCSLDTSGAITMEDAGSVVVRGMTIEQAERALRTQLRRYLTGADCTLTLGKLRTIQVTVSGSIWQPGTFAAPAVATAYNLLYAAGGPTPEGSMRAVEVRRGGKLVGTLDVYRFILVGSASADIALESGDLIYVPRRRSQIAVSGEVVEPALFELTPGETLQDALRYCGGIKASGVEQRVRINTVTPGASRVLRDVDAANGAAARQTLYDGDRVLVTSVRPELTNRVTVEGAVDQPSDYALTPGMKVSDLLQRARGPLSEAYLLHATLYRWNPDTTTTLISIDLNRALAHDPVADVTLARWDRLKVFTRQEVAWTGRRAVTVRGAVQRPGVYSHSANMRVLDLLMMAGGVTPDAFLERAVLLHQHGDGTYGMEYVNLNSAMKDDQTRNIGLQDDDVLAVYKSGEAQFEPEHLVTVRGEVVAEGAYPRSEGMKLSDLLNLAGGFRPGARSSVTIAHARRMADAQDGAMRVVTVNFDSSRHCAPQDDALVEDGDVVTVQGTGGFMNQVETVTIRGAVNNPGPVVLTSKKMRLSDAIKLAGGLRPEAFPRGAEFVRDPRRLSTDQQHDLSVMVSALNDLVNDNTYHRERGKSYLERIRALGAASKPEQGGIAGLAGAADTEGQAGSLESGALAARLSQNETVTPARKLADSSLNPNGVVAVNLPEALQRPGSAEDVLLANGDVITVPEIPTTVQVVGAVISARAVLYKPGSPLSYYIAQAGGFAPDAATDRLEVIRVGGGLLPARQAKQILPGDMILAPTRVMAEKIASHGNSFDSLFKSLTSSAIVFKLATGIFGL